MTSSSWSLHERDGIGELLLDIPGRTHNTLGREVLSELDQMLGILEGRPLQGLIVRSGKAQSFLVGVDVRAFRRVFEAARAAELMRAGQLVLDRLSRLPYPSVAVIHGPCLGGGLELALACSYRIVCDEERTVLGFPEVKFGIHPGFGGTVRLPALIGAIPALSLLLKGRTISAHKAHALGLCDAKVAEHHLLSVAREFLNTVPPKGRPPWYQTWTELPFLRPYVAAFLRRIWAAQVGSRHYLAPARILSLWARQASAETEALSCGELLVSPVSRHLMRLFDVSQELKAVSCASCSKTRWVHVIGAGIMGADIAAWAALRGFSVSLQDREPPILARAVERAHAIFSEKLNEREALRARDRFMPDLKGAALSRADLVIETISEDFEAKRALFADMEHRVADHVILATNTVSMPLDALASSLKVPGRFVGLHFFNPVASTRIVEVVAGPRSAPEALTVVRDFVAALDKLPLDVSGVPGFLVNRTLIPYLLEAITLAQEGVAITDIDNAALEFGMTMGPMAMADSLGLDVCLQVARSLSGAQDLAVPALLVSKVEAGLLGMKTGHGFYVYPRRRILWPTKAASLDPMVTERLVMRFINEAARSLREGIVSDADVVDIGLVYGAGFAPFRGGPLAYAEALGLTEVQGRLNDLAQRFGERFMPDRAWQSPALFVRRPLSS